MELSIVGGNQGAEREDKCTVRVNGNTCTFNDFVAIGFHDDDDKAEVFACTDMLTLAVSLELLNSFFKSQFEAMDFEDQRNLITTLKEVMHEGGVFDEQG